MSWCCVLNERQSPSILSKGDLVSLIPSLDLILRNVDINQEHSLVECYIFRYSSKAQALILKIYGKMYNKMYSSSFYADIVTRTLLM